MSDRCELSGLLVEQCACRIHGQRPDQGLGVFGAHRAPTIEARCVTTCPACDDDIQPGDRITRTDDGWVHEGCVE